MYHDLAQRLPDTIEPIGIRPPGRESRWAEPPFTSLRALVESLVDAVADQLVAPYALLGGCSGALLAFEAARCLRRRGLPPPQLLVVLSHEAPHLVTGPPPEAADDPIDRLLTLGWTTESAATRPELLRLLRRLAEADFAVVDNYTCEPEPPLEVPISVLAGHDDPELTPADLVAWRTQTTRDFTLRWIDGSHHLVNSNPDGIVRALQADGGR
jgi:surfactin synthase thioesterase subunit